MNWNLLAFSACVLAAIPAVLTLINHFFYRPIRRRSLDHDKSSLSVLIPARNEAANIARTVASVLANRGVEFEVIVLDDHSEDATAAIVAEIAARDSRVRLEFAPALPAGWCGKPHACHVLAQHAKFATLVFIDADVRLESDALVRMAQFLEASQVDLASGVPLQELGTFSERLLLSQIHFVLLGYLPLPLMCWTKLPAFSAGCGQLFVARRDAYLATGGHSMIRQTLHDGVRLPRLFRRFGFRTGLFDATDLATCRMYRTNGEVWCGLAKNATEGLAAPGAILPMSVLMFGGQVLPFVLAGLIPAMNFSGMIATVLAMTFAWTPRLIAVSRFRQPLGSALLHPLGIAALLVIQWWALARKLAGKPAVWKGRSYSSTPTTA